MNCFFAIISVPFLLCAVISQAAPMVEKTEAEKTFAPPPASVTMQEQIGAPIQPVSLELKPQVQSTVETLQCATQTQSRSCSQDGETVSCPLECKQPKSDGTDPPTEEPKKVEHGWINGLKNLVKVCYKAFSESMVGEQGYLTLLPQRFAAGGAAKKPKKKRPKRSGNRGDGGNGGNGDNNNNGGGRQMACCIFNKPPVKDEEEDDNETSDNDQVPPPPLHCVWIQNKIDKIISGPGSDGAPAITPVVPGAKNKTKTTTTNCCCVGRSMLKIKNFIRAIIKPQFNCCAATVNFHLFDKA